MTLSRRIPYRIQKMIGTAALAVIAMVSASTIAFAETRYALIVGHNIGHLDETPLRWAESDATRVRTLLTEIGNVQSDRAVLLLSPKPSDLERALVQMEGRLLEAEHRGEKTLFFFYFSGHADREALHLGPASVPLRRLEDKLERGPATTTLTIIDACQNDRNPRVKTKGAVRAPAFSWPTLTENTPAGYVSIRSAAAGEVAQESDDLQGSLFTHHLLSGMRGSADFDGDGTVTLTELYRYGYSRTLEDTHRATQAVQHSELDMKLSGRGAFVVTYPRRAVATLVLSPELSGHALLIDDVSGRIVAEVHQDGGRAQKLAVAPGAYRVQLRGKDDIRTGLVSLGTGERTVSSADLTVRPTLAVLAKGVSYDPNPLVLSAGPEVSSSLVEGFGVSTGLRMGTDYRISERLRWVVRAEARYASTENEWWRFRQAELGLSTGLDAVVWTGERFSMVIGARGGLAAVLQESQRVDQSRLIDGWIPRASTETDGADLGPEFTAVWALEYFPWSHLGGRLYIEPSVWWMPSENQSDLRYGVSGGLSLMVRL